MKGKGQEMHADNEINLAAGRLRLALSPSIGGAISAFEWIDGEVAQSILRKCHRPLEKVLDAASFPLVPYVNRIRGGQFVFRGRDVRLAPNMAGDSSPLHGQGWLGIWAVEAADDQSAVLCFIHEGGEWPWSYEARQEFALDECGLQLVLTCRNLAREPMPCGLGQHPYFDCGPQTRLDTEVGCAWTIDEHVLPVSRVRAEGRYDLRNRSACGQGLDNGFGGWSGRAAMSDPDWPFEIELSSPDAHFFQLYSPPEGSIFVAEPVTHANAALNAPEEAWPELGMRVLDPGEAMSLHVKLEVISR